MTGRYTPSFPRTVSGKNFREPLDHPDAEALGAAMNRLYREVDLTDLQRGRLLKDYAILTKHDEKFMIWFRGSHIPDLVIDEDRLRNLVTPPSHEARYASLYGRIRRYINELKCKYPETSELGDDI